MRSEGFSIIEVLVAATIVVSGVASLAQLFVMSARANRIASTSSMTLLLAVQKMENLLGETGLGSSPPGSLSASTPGYVDHLDASGRPLGITAIPPPPDSLAPDTPPPGTAYICRWSIAPLSDSPVTAMVVQVLVTRWPDGAGVSRLVSVKARKGS